MTFGTLGGLETQDTRVLVVCAAYLEGYGGLGFRV